MNAQDFGPLRLYEECLLLAIGDRTGAVLVMGQQASVLAASAILSELLLDGVVELEGPSKSVIFKQHQQYEDPNLQNIVTKLSEAKATYSLEHWLGRIAALTSFVDKCIQRLCDRGILESKEETVLWFFNRKTYPELDPEPENEIRERVRGAIKSEGEVPPKLVTLVGLAAQMNLLKTFMSVSELNEYADRIKKLSDGDSSVNATRKVIASQQAAANCAVTGALMMTTLMD